AIIFIFLTILLLFSLYELYTISALYNDQASMSEILAGAANQKTSQAETTQLNDFKFELNSWRAIYVLYILFFIFYVVRMFLKALRPAN
ncbi:MAG TPA: hypothetical protein VNX01_11260, partial [Bacteroidia bacterium]|nr:hypothetical protein [Bacteroidia bacterium]